MPPREEHAESDNLEYGGYESLAGCRPRTVGKVGRYCGTCDWVASRPQKAGPKSV